MLVRLSVPVILKLQKPLFSRVERLSFKSVITTITTTTTTATTTTTTTTTTTPTTSQSHFVFLVLKLVSFTQSSQPKGILIDRGKQKTAFRVREPRIHRMKESIKPTKRTAPQSIHTFAGKVVQNQVESS